MCLSRPGVKLTPGGENEEGIYNLQRGVQDASCRGDQTRQIYNGITSAKSLWHLRNVHDTDRLTMKHRKKGMGLRHKMCQPILGLDR